MLVLYCNVLQIQASDGFQGSKYILRILTAMIRYADSFLENIANFR